MGSILVLIMATTHKSVNDENRSTDYDPCQWQFASLCSSLQAVFGVFFSAYKMHADELQVNQFLLSTAIQRDNRPQLCPEQEKERTKHQGRLSWKMAT